MAVQLHLQGATIELDDVALEDLARQLAPHVAGVLGQDDGENGDSGWIRGAAAAAEYLGCPRTRIYELVEQDRVEYRKDGIPPASGARDRRPLVFKREWLDATLDQGLRV